MPHLLITLPNCHGNLPTNWHDSHGGKWSKTFCIIPGSRKSWRQMEGGGWCLPGCTAETLPREISWWGWWPALTSMQLKEQNPPQLSLPYPLQQGTLLLWSYLSCSCWAAPWLLDWCLWDWCPLYAQSLDLLCPCQCGSEWCKAHPLAPSFCNEKVFLNSYIMKSGKTCPEPFLALGGAFRVNEQPWRSDHLHSLTWVTWAKILS